MAGVSGMRMNVDEMIAEGDRVSVRGVMSGKHTGEFMGVPPTGNQLNVPLSDYFRIANGKIAEHWGVMDSGAMLMQLGVVQMPG
jgi:predicted ester cyclase